MRRRNWSKEVPPWRNAMSQCGERERSLATNSLGRTAASFCDFALVKPGFRPWNYTQTDKKSFVDHLIQKNLEPSDGEPQKWPKKSPNCPKCNYFSQHCQWVIRKRECPLCWCTERREVFNPHVRKQLIHRLFATYEERAPMHSLLMCYACAVSNLNTTCFFLKKTAIQMSKEDAIPRLWGAYQKLWRSHLLDQKSSFKVPTRGIAHPDRWKSRSRCHGQKTNWIKIGIV